MYNGNARFQHLHLSRINHGNVSRISSDLPTRLRKGTQRIQNSHWFLKIQPIPCSTFNLICSFHQIGLLLTANGVGTMIVLSFVKVIIGKLGEANTLVISMLLFAVRFVIFYYLQ